MSDSQSPRQVQRAALRIAAIYAITAITWIVLSDYLTELLVPAPLHTALQITKGTLFVGVTCALLYTLIVRDLRHLQRTEQRYRAIFESSHDALLIFDQRGRFLDVNPAALELSGYSHAEMLQHSVVDLTPPEDRAAFSERLSELLPTVPTAAPRDRRLLRKDGSIVPVEVTLGPQPMLGDQVYLSVLRDVSQRRRVEAALQDSEARFRSLFENAPLAIAIAYTGYNRYVNPAYVQLFGYNSSAEIEGQPLLEQVAPQDRPLIAERNRRRLAGLEVPSSYEMLGLRKDGSTVPCQVHVRHMQLPEGTASVAFLTDITTRKQAEAHIQQQSARANALAEISRALAEQNLDHHAVLSTMTQLTGEIVGDGCLIRLLSEDGTTLQTGAVYHHDPAAHDFIQYVLGNEAQPVDLALHMRVLQSGQPQLLERMEPTLLYPLLKPEQQALADSFGPHSGLVVGLRAHGRALGTMMVLRRAAQPLFSDEDQLFIQELADRAALAVDNARLYYASQEEIVERRRAEQALRVSEEQYRMLFDNHPQPVWVFDSATLRFLAVNDAAVRQYGYSRDEFLRMTIKDIRPAEEVPALLYNLEEHEPDGRSHRLWQHRRKDGTLLDVEITRHSLRFAGREARLVLALDVTERRRAERTLLESETNLRAIFDGAQQSMMLVADDYRVLDFNHFAARAALRVYGHQMQVGQSILDYVAPENHDSFVEHFQRTLAGRSCTVELLINGAHSGSWWEFFFNPIAQPDGTVNRIIFAARNIDERKRAEAALRETEAREQAILNGTSDPIFLKDLEGRYLVINPASARVLGCSVQAAIGKRDDELSSDPIAALFVASDQRVIQTGQQIQEQHEVPIEGSLRSFLSLKAPYRDAQGTVQGVIGISRDITELNQAMAALRKSEATNRALLDAIPDLMLRISRDGRYRDSHAPSRYEELIRLEQFANRTIDETMPADLAQQTHACIQRTLSTGEIQTSEYQVALGGKLREFEGRFVVSGEDEVLVIVRDVTERKRLERALRDARDVYLTLVEEIPLLVWRLNRHGRMDFVNKRWIEFTGYSVEELPAEASDLIHPDERAQIRATVARAWHEQQPFKVEYQLRRHDGVYCWMEARGTPFYDEEGQMAGTIGTISDISDRKRQEQIKDDFLALASHELKTPLAALLGYIHLLERWSKPHAFSARINEALAAMVAEGNRLNRLINDLLDVSRIQTGKLRMFMHATDLTELVRQCITNLQVMLPEHHWRLEIAAEQPLVISADAQRIEQVLTNLCTNAAKYSAEHAPVRVTLRRVGQHAQITVQDHGLGIPASDLPHIFERFYQVQRPPRESRPGLGLGLYITYEIVRQHSGTITVDSVERGGSIFTILLPLDQSAATQS